MGLLFWYSLALFIILIWTAAVMAIYGKWKDAIEKHHFSVMGPFVMWKTVKGKKIIESIAEKRAKWVELYGRIAVAITGVSMVIMTGVLFLSAYLVVEKARDIHIEPHMLLGLPGLNPLIPLWYGIFALVIAMLIHEFSHGFLSALAKVKILSLGIMFFIFPMGAFVEPDEEGLMKIEKKKRVRMYSAGPASNIILAGVLMVVFSVILMGSVQPVTQGVGIISTPEPIEIESIDFTMNTPAMNASLDKGMMITSFNGTRILDRGDFNEALNNTRPHQNVTIVYLSDGQNHTENVTLTFKGYYFQDIYGDNYTARVLDNLGWDNTPENEAKVFDWYINKGYLGVSSMTLSTDHFHPIGDSKTLGDMGQSMAIYFTLPLSGLSTVEGPTMDFYEITGFWSFLPDNVFWVIANATYWVFWLNLMVGLSNALPAVPLDGGYIFKDWLDSLIGKSKNYQDEKKRTNIVNKIAFVVALMILFLILWQVIGPRVIPLL